MDPLDGWLEALSRAGMPVVLVFAVLLLIVRLTKRQRAKLESSEEGRRLIRQHSEFMVWQGVRMLPAAMAAMALSFGIAIAAGERFDAIPHAWAVLAALCILFFILAWKLTVFLFPSWGKAAHLEKTE